MRNWVSYFWSKILRSVKIFPLSLFSSGIGKKQPSKRIVKWILVAMDDHWWNNTVYLHKVLKNIKVTIGICFALKSLKEYVLLFIYLMSLNKDVSFPLITKFKTNKNLSFLSVNEYRIKMRPHRLIHNINRPVLNFTFGLFFLSVISIILFEHHLLSD